MVGQREGLVSGNSVKKADRTKGGKYVDTKDRICIWSGNRWNCEHNRERSGCKECGGTSICEHGRVRSVCKECGGASICEHGRRRSHCKECGGSSICVHGRVRSHCKECGGSQICEHGKRKYTCKECKSRKVLAVQPLIVSASDVAFGDAADDTAMSLALPPR